MQFIQEFIFAGLGNLSLMLTWLRARESIQKCQVPSFFFTKRTGEEKELWIWRMMCPISTFQQQAV